MNGVYKGQLITAPLYPSCGYNVVCSAVGLGLSSSLFDENLNFFTDLKR